jgi:hypothetical protein
VRTRQFSAAVSNQRSVNIDFAHVVDDHCQPPALLIVQDVAEHRGLSCA